MPVHATKHGLPRLGVKLPREGRVFVALRLGRRGRQTFKIRRSVVTPTAQDRRAANNDRKAFRARPEQHRQHAVIHVVGDDDVGREILQDLLQTLVLGRDGIDQDAANHRAGLFWPGRKIPQFGNHCENVAQIQIRARGKRMEFESGAFDAVA